MHESSQQVHLHMRDFGISVLGRALYDVTYCESTRPYAHALAVVHAAHGAEIVLKARIAQEHPLLIFSRLPSSDKCENDLTFEDLLEHGRSIDYFDLPERLWAATGYRLRDLRAYQAFGKLRNQIVHFAVPELETLGDATMKFLIETMEPLLEEFWKESAIPIAEVWDDGVLTSDGHLLEAIERRNIRMTESVRRRLESPAG